MEPRKYDHATAKAIFEMIGWPESWVIRDDGVFVADGFRCCSPIDKAFDWTPAYDMDWPGAPNPMTAPTLPIEFTARQLAASMIDGVGRHIQDALNRRIGYALDDAALQGFGSYHSWVRDALTEAYDVARQAQDVVGELDHDQQQRAYDLLAQYDEAYGQALEREKVMERVIIGKHKNENPEYGGFIATGDEYLLRLARAKESVAAQKAQALQAKEQADAALKAWRKAMVRQLLQPPAATPSPAPLVPTWDELHALRGVDARKEFEAWSKARANKSSEIDKAFIDEIAIGDEIAALQEKIEKWERRDCTQPSELEPLYAQMKKLDAVQKYLRGDYGPKVITPSPAPEPQAAPVVAASAPDGVRWTLVKPQRFQGYGKPLYDLLKAAHIAGRPRPNARDVLETWREKAPLEVAVVLADSLDYYDAKGDTKPASLETIRKAIGRMTS